MVELHQSLEEEYKIVQAQGGFTPRYFNVIHLKGNEVRDFLHRLSTNDFQDFYPFHVRATVLTTEKAKVVDVLTAISVEDGILLLTSPANGPTVSAWLEKFVLSENIQITDVTSFYAIISIVGSNAFSLARRELELQDSPEPGIAIVARFKKREIVVFADPFWSGTMVNVLVKVQDSNELSTSLGLKLPEVSVAGLERLRIENGIPLLGKELSEHVNPLEAGLEKLVSFSKGCYIGQEVIARIDTYKKLQRRLHGFTIDRPMSPEPLSGGKLCVAGGEVGWTTSHVWSFQSDAEIALGYLDTGLEIQEFNFIPSGRTLAYSAKISLVPFGS